MLASPAANSSRPSTKSYILKQIFKLTVCQVFTGIVMVPMWVDSSDSSAASAASAYSAACPLRRQAAQPGPDNTRQRVLPRRREPIRLMPFLDCAASSFAPWRTGSSAPNG